MSAALFLALAFIPSGRAWAVDETPAPEVRKDALVSIRAEPDLPALSFADLHGFEGTHHLVPVLLPAEARYSDLRNAKEVQDALKVDPLLRDLSDALGKAVQEEFASVPTGRRLLETLARPVPPILLADSKEVIGAYKSMLDAVALNWRDVRDQFPEAKELDCAGLERWLLEEPGRVRRLAHDFAPILAHELTHARQNALFGLASEDVPNGGRYLEMEEEAYFMEMSYHLEAAEADPTLLVSSSPLNTKVGEELFVFVWDIDRYLEAIRASYAAKARRHAAVPLPQALARQRTLLKTAPPERRAGLHRGLIALERARLHYDKRVQEMLDEEWPSLSVRGMLLFAKRDARRRPPLAMALVYRAGQRSREQDEIQGSRTFEERRPEFERLFREAAWEDLSSLLAGESASAPKTIRRRYAELVGELCSDLKLDCRELVRDVLEREAPPASSVKKG